MESLRAGVLWYGDRSICVGSGSTAPASPPFLTWSDVVSRSIVKAGVKKILAPAAYFCGLSRILLQTDLAWPFWLLLRFFHALSNMKDAPPCQAFVAIVS